MELLVLQESFKLQTPNWRIPEAVNGSSTLQTVFIVETLCN